MSAAEQWGLPDWQDAGAYPALDDLTKLEWWWEFTRRRSDYRDLWAQAAGGGITTDGLRAAPDVDIARVKYQVSRLLDPVRQYPGWTLFQVCYPRNYGIQPSHSPVLDDPSHVLFKGASQWHNKREKLAEEAGHYRYNFDVNLPLEPQLERAAAHLKRMQSEIKGKLLRDTYITKGRHRWPEYLRVLDAHEEGAGPSEIARTIWPGDEAKRPSSADAALKQARHIQNNFPI